MAEMVDLIYDDADPDNPGWVLHWRRWDGEVLEEFLEAPDPWRRDLAEEEAERFLLEQGDLNRPSSPHPGAE